MQTINLKQFPDLKRVVQAAFPAYRKPNVFVSVFTGDKTINSYWDGGSRSYYVAVHIPTLQDRSLPTATHPYFDLDSASGSTPDVDVHNGIVTLKRLPVDVVLIEGGTFCGKTATAHVYLHPENAGNFLPAGMRQ